MKISDEKKSLAIDAATEYGSSVASSTVGALIGGTVTGPAGAVGGAIVAATLEHVFTIIGKEIKERFLSRSEERKINAVYSIAHDEIQEKINNGDEIRNDDFFTYTDNERSTAEEILEGTLFAAQRASEEKKIRYYAKLYANIAFDETITRPIANQLVKIAEQLTYRQIVILHIIGLSQIKQQTNRYKNTAYKSMADLTNMTIASEIFELYRMSLLSSSQAFLDCVGINPSTLLISGYGALIFNLMELSQLEEDDDLTQMIYEINMYLEGHGGT